MCIYLFIYLLINCFVYLFTFPLGILIFYFNERVVIILLVNHIVNVGESSLFSLY